MSKELFISAVAVAAAVLAATLFNTQTASIAHSVNRWEHEIREFELADRQTPASPGAVLFIGSSSIRLWKHLKNDFPSTQVLNRGFGGAELEDCIYYADRIIVPYRPRLIFLYAGDNDLANGKTPEQVFEDYKQLVNYVHQKLPNTRIIYLSIKPSPARWRWVANIRAANSMIQHYTMHHQALGYIDVFTPMLRADGTPRTELYTQDKLHLNQAGYTLWKTLVAPQIK